MGSYSYNAHNQPQVSGYSFDLNGNPTQYASQTLGFDREDRLTQLGATFTAGYNGEGMRAWKQVGSTRSYFVYDGATPIIELDGNGAITAINTYGAAGLVSRRTGGVSGPTTFYTFDPQGNVCQRLNSSAAATSTDTFDAFGQPATGNANDVFGYGGSKVMSTSDFRLSTTIANP